VWKRKRSVTDARALNWFFYPHALRSPTAKFDERLARMRDSHSSKSAELRTEGTLGMQRRTGCPVATVLW